MSYFFKVYKEKIFWDMYYKYFFKNWMEIPFINKIVLNSCCGSFFFNKNIFNSFYSSLYDVFIQKPLIVKSKKSISEFKLKKKDNLAIKITLRKNKMYNFFYKFLVFSLPLIKNFKGFSKKSFDVFGNYNFGIDNCNIFLELYNIDYQEILSGINFNIVISNSNPEKSFNLLNFFNFPFFND